MWKFGHETALKILSPSNWLIQEWRTQGDKDAICGCLVEWDIFIQSDNPCLTNYAARLQVSSFDPQFKAYFSEAINRDSQLFPCIRNTVSFFSHASELLFSKLLMHCQTVLAWHRLALVIVFSNIGHKKFWPLKTGWNLVEVVTKKDFSHDTLKHILTHLYSSY